MKVFLGGTCNGSKWREEIIPMLNIDYFNPVVDDWNEAAQTRELVERSSCDFCLYCITPAMTGVYSIAEIIDDSNKRPKKTVFVLLESHDAIGFADHKLRSLQQVSKMVARNGAKVFSNLATAANWMNGDVVEVAKAYESLKGHE